MDPRGLAAIVLVFPALAAAQPAQPFRGDFAVDDAARERFVTDVTRELEQKFLYPDVVKKKLPSLLGRWSSPPFSTLTSASELVAAMNADLTDAFHDGHLMLLPLRAEDMPPGAFNSGAPTAGELVAMDKEESAMSYGIVEARVMDGNIGYLELMHFPDVHLAGLPRAIAAAMQRLHDTRGLIIDLRWNGGGDGDTVAHLVAYLLDRPALLLREYDRVTGKHTEHWSPASVPGPHYGGKRPVWVLTSHGTFSGGEELAYDLQTLKRARLVGETTGGGAHHNAVVRVGDHFALSIPVGTGESPVTHTNWERVGVKPDVPVAAERALDVALAEARRSLHQ